MVSSCDRQLFIISPDITISSLLTFLQKVSPIYIIMHVNHVKMLVLKIFSENIGDSGIILVYSLS